MYKNLRQGIFLSEEQFLAALNNLDPSNSKLIAYAILNILKVRAFLRND